MSVDEWDEVWAMTFGLSWTAKAAQLGGHSDQYDQPVQSPENGQSSEILRLSVVEPRMNNRIDVENALAGYTEPLRAKRRY